MSVIAHVYQRPRCMDDDSSAGDHDQAPTRSGRPRRRTMATDPQISSDNHSSPRFKSEQMHGAFQNQERDRWTRSQCHSPGEAQRHGTLWTMKHWKRLAHNMVYVRCATFFDTLSREFLMLILVGRSEDIRLALPRREQRETKDKKSNVANFLDAQWVRGKALSRGHRGTPWEKAPNDCDHPPNAVQKGGNAVMCCERCEMCGNRCQRIPLTMVARDPETKLNNRAVLASAGQRPVEIERPFCPHGYGNATAEPPLEMLDVWYHLRTQPGRVRCSTCRPGELRGCRREHGSIGVDETLGRAGRLKGVDQEVHLPLIHETGQRLENQSTNLGFVSRQKVELGEQVRIFQHA